MRKKIVIIIIIVILALIGYCIYLVYDYKKDMAEKHEELLILEMEYLESNYFEKMIIEDEISYYDGVYTLTAHPENIPEFHFYICYIENKVRWKDDYLTRHAEWTAWQMVRKIMEQYISNYDGHTIINEYPDIPKKLLCYYNENHRPMSWDDEAHLEKIDIVHIRLFGYDEILEVEYLYEILDKIRELNVAIEEVGFNYYKNEDKREPEFSQIFILKEGEYILQEE